MFGLLIHLIAWVLIIVGVGRAAGTVLAYRDRLREPGAVKSLLLMSSPSLGIAFVGWVLLHGLPTIPGVSLGMLALLYFTASCVAGSAMQIARAVGRVEAIPSRTLLVALLDGFIVAQMTGGSGALYTIISSAFCLAFVAWLISKIAHVIAGPVLARRRAEADAAMAAMGSEEGER